MTRTGNRWITVGTTRAALCVAAALLVSGCILDVHGTRQQTDGGAGGAPGASSSGSGTPAAHTYRRRIAIAADAADVPAGYSVQIVIDHAALVAAGRSLASGEDVKIVRVESGGLNEVDRVLDPASSWNRSDTAIWFSTYEAIAAGQIDDAYYVVYGDSTPDPPRSDGRNVFLFWDDFDGPDLDARWTLDDIGAAAGRIERVKGKDEDGALRITTKSGDISGHKDDFTYFHVRAEGDISVEAVMTAYGGTLGDKAKLGGVMIRQSTAAGARHVMTCRHHDATRISAYREVDDALTFAAEMSADGPFVPERSRIDRVGGLTKTYWGADGAPLTAVGNGVSFAQPLVDPIRVGIPLATNKPGEDGWVEIDWFRVRPLVTPEPQATVSPDEEVE